MSTERPDSRSALPRRIDAVPTPRSGIPSVGFGVSAISAAPAPPPPPEEPEHRSRAVTIVAGFLVLVTLVAAVVAFKILVPSTPSASAEVAPETTEVREQPGTVVRFGDPHTYGDGLEVAVNPPQRYQPSDNATGAEEGVAVKVLVVLTNRTDEPFRPNTLQAAVTSAGQAASPVWDPDQGIALTGPDITVAPGASIHFHLAFAVADPGDVRLEVTPALFGYGPTVVERS